MRGRRPGGPRGALLRRLGDLVERDADRLGAIEQRDNGKLIAEVSGQVRDVAQWFHYCAGLADKVQGAVVPHPVVPGRYRPETTSLR